MCGIRAKDWNTMPMSLRRTCNRSLSLRPVISRPLRKMVPAVGSMRRLNSRTMVDLPEPDSPMITKISPRMTEKLASKTPMTWPVFSNTSALEAPALTSAMAVSA